MKFFRTILLAFSLLFSLAISLPVQAEERCSCSCMPGYQLEGFQAVGQPAPSGVQTKSGTGQIFTLPGSVLASECDSLCNKNKPADASWAKEVACTKSDCWCKKGEDFQFLYQTADQGACQKACTDAKLDFASWNTAPPNKTSAIKCPPGGIWTEAECLAQKDSMGDKIGEWIAPSAADTKGPYCYVMQKPVKLNVAIGGLTSANLGQYLTAAYRLGLGMAAVLAVIFIMVGGFRYIASAGGGGIGQGKEMIKNAVVGLILTALSYTLLQTVNPDILSLKLPRVQLIKACNLGVSCAARSDKETCEKNTSTSGVRCIWNINQSSCYDNSLMQTGTVGQNGGECRVDSNGAKSCTDGSKPITISSNECRCSKGAVCQSCNNDSDCGSSSGAVGKCDPTDKVCLIPNPNGTAGSYAKCSGGTCQANTDCDTGFCNTSTGTCRPANQGASCLQMSGGLIADQNSCAAGSTCIPFTRNGNSGDLLWKAACCLNGDKENCLGCDPTNTIKTANGESNINCPATMKCNSTGRCVTK